MAGEFRMTFADAFVFSTRMLQAPSVVENELEHAVDRLTLIGEGVAKKKVPVHTGHLRRSIASRPATVAGGRVTGSFGTATVYAAQVEYGGEITAKNAPYLIFRSPKAVSESNPKGWVSVKSVLQEGKPYMRPAKTVVEEKMAGEFQAAMRAIATQLGMGGGE